MYSEKRLAISAPGTTEATLGSGSAYNLRYAGLRLLEAARDRYVLLNEHGGHVIVLREADGVRFEFSTLP
jgi:hypothetical protein